MDVVGIADLRRAASQRAHKMVFDYIDGGCDDEITLRRNHDAYSDLEMHYGVLSGKGVADFRTTLFGKDVDLPFFCAPTAGQKMFHRDGESAAARICGEEKMLYCLSAMATTDLETIGSLIPDSPKLFQVSAS